jgi:hypothetical protein
MAINKVLQQLEMAGISCISHQATMRITSAASAGCNLLILHMLCSKQLRFERLNRHLRVANLIAEP